MYAICHHMSSLDRSNRRVNASIFFFVLSSLAMRSKLSPAAKEHFLQNQIGVSVGAFSIEMCAIIKTHFFLPIFDRYRHRSFGSAHYLCIWWTRQGKGLFRLAWSCHSANDEYATLLIFLKDKEEEVTVSGTELVPVGRVFCWGSGLEFSHLGRRTPTKSTRLLRSSDHPTCWCWCCKLSAVRLRYVLSRSDLDLLLLGFVNFK